MKLSLRLFAVASATFCGVYFLGGLIKLLVGYNYTYHRFAPGLVRRNDFIYTALLGVGFFASVVCIERW